MASLPLVTLLGRCGPLSRSEWATIYQPQQRHTNSLQVCTYTRWCYRAYGHYQHSFSRCFLQFGSFHIPFSGELRPADEKPGCRLIFSTISAATCGTGPWLQTLAARPARCRRGVIRGLVGCAMLSNTLYSSTTELASSSLM